MNINPSKKHPVHLLKNPFAYIALWQFLTFIMLALTVWVNELQDIPAMLFNTNPQNLNIFRGCLLTACVLAVAIITIGNTKASLLFSALCAARQDCAFVALSANLSSEALNREAL